MGMFKPAHIIILILVLVLLFGASKLPDIAKNLGQSAKVLKKEMKELTDEEKQAGSNSAVNASGPVVTNNPMPPVVTSDPASPVQQPEQFPETVDPNQSHR